MKAISRLAVVSWAILGCVAAGCSDSLPNRVPVSGRVTIDGQPVTSGWVRFAPLSGGRTATGQILQDGSFVMTTYTKADGCTLGSHRVTIESYQDVNGTTRHWLLPKKYAIPSTSGLEFRVDEATDSAQFELTWNGKKGPEIERYVD